MKTIEVCAAIIIKDDKLFITQRGYGEFINKWEFPGGKIEINETKENCIIREIKEELDADIKIIKFLNTIEYTYPTFHLIMHNFICELKHNHIILKEHEGAKFIDTKDINNYDFLPADKLIFEDLLNYFNQLKK